MCLRSAEPPEHARRSGSLERQVGLAELHFNHVQPHPRLRASGQIALCPFPIDCETFYPSPREGSSFRRSLGVRPDELVLLYTGRLSLQKNTTVLARLLGDYARSRGVSLTFAFAGEVDDIGADFLGIELGTGFYRHHFLHELLENMKGSSVRVAALGNLDLNDLRCAYNASDLFVSLSMHHDEDFGMSPGEALCCGTPVLLSGWGGFHSFPLHVTPELRADAVRVIELETSGANVGIPSKRFFRALDRRRSGAPAASLRGRIAESAAASLSIPAAAARLQKLVRGPVPSFAGFSQLLEKLAQLAQVPGRFRAKRFDDPTYRKLYSPYFRPAACANSASE